MQNKYNILTISVTGCFLLFLFLILRYYLSYSFIFLDDANSNFYCTLVEWKDIFRVNEFCLCLSPILGRLFGAMLPYELNMHPSSFKSIYFSYIEAFLLIAFVILIAKLFNKKNGYELPVSILFSASALLFYIQNQPLTLIVYDVLFRMLLPVFLWCVFFLSLINDIKNNKNNIYKYQITEKYI